MLIFLQQGILGSLIGMIIFYLLSSLILRRWIRIDIYKLVLYMTVSFLVAIVCEVCLGKLYFIVIGEPLWQYHVWPIHDGYTSVLNFIIWPVYGYYLYFLHYILQSKRISLRPYWLHGLSSGIDGPLLEILANGFFLLFYGTFYFYYLPDDMRHWTSIQVVPLYMVMGIILTMLLEYLQKQTPNWKYPLGFYLAGVVFVILG